VDQNQDDSKYSEFCKYRANPESMDQEILTTVVFSDPIYGDVIRSTCSIEFEYHTTDIIRFNRRKFDFIISRFISDKTTCYLPIPETDRKMKFSVVWHRQDAVGDNPLMKMLGLNETSKNQLSFKFSAKLVITLYRLSNRYPVIKTKSLHPPKWLEPSLPK